jgi:hypothetical protein
LLVTLRYHIACFKSTVCYNEIILLVKGQLLVTLCNHIGFIINWTSSFKANMRQAQPVWRTKSYNFKRECCLQCNLIARYNSTACYNEMLLRVTNQLLVTNKSHCLLPINCLLQCNLIVSTDLWQAIWFHCNKQLIWNKQCDIVV